MPDREPQPQFDVRPANRMMCLRDLEGKIHVFGVQSTSVCWLAKLSVQVLAGQTVFIEKGALKIFSMADFGTSPAALLQPGVECVNCRREVSADLSRRWDRIHPGRLSC